MLISRVPAGPAHDLPEVGNNKEVENSESNENITQVVLYTFYNCANMCVSSLI